MTSTESSQSDRGDSKKLTDEKVDKLNKAEIPPKYGVCDNPEQFAKKFSKWKGYIITRKIEREKQPP